MMLCRVLNRLVRPAIFVALLLPCAALAWAPTIRSGGGRMVRSGGSNPIVLSIPADQCGASLSATNGQSVTVTRSTTGTYDCGGLQTAAANQPRVSESGLLSESARTQHLLNNCSAPATQTVSLGVGTFTGWIEGAGSLTFAAGTATVTGLPCTATSVSDCVFAVSAGGTVTATVTAPVMFMQLENGIPRTSKICASSAPAPRAADVASTANRVNVSADWFIKAELTPTGQSWDGNATRSPFAFGAFGSANSLYVFDNGNGTLATRLYDAAGTFKAVLTTTPIAGTRTIAVCGGPSGALTMYIDGFSIGAVAGTGTGILSAAQPVFLGGDFNGTIRNIQAGRGCRPYQAPGERHAVACLGDSLTYGSRLGVGEDPYPLTLQGLLGAPWTTRNSGVAGNLTSQMKARLESELLPPGAFSHLALLGGVNDLASNMTSAQVLANLTAMAEEATANGIAPVLMTVAPWKGSEWWSEARQSEQDTLNAAILAYCTANSLTCVDVYADFNDGTGALKVAYDSGDKIHFNKAGADRLAALVKAAISP